jgi:predicted transposase/invertase (TIGR01784 family)
LFRPEDSFNFQVMPAPDEHSPNPVQEHDGFFKTIFSQPEHATAFFKSHLPPTIVARIAWASLKLVPGSFVKTNLQQLHSDLLFSVRIGDRETLLYLLFEHQSTPDPAMPLRLLAYMTEIFTRHHKSHGFPLPPVLPFVFYQGPKTWTASTRFEDLFELPEDLATELFPFLPRFQHALLDLTDFDPATEEIDIQLRVVLQLMKLARQNEIHRFFQWLALIPAEGLPKSLLEFILLYALYSDGELDAEGIYHTLELNPELKNNIMSVAEQLIAKGRVEGRVEGLVVGEEKGSWIGQIRAFEEFLAEPITSSQDLSKLTIEELEGRHRDLRKEYQLRFKV